MYKRQAQIFPVLIAALYWARSTRPGILAGLATGCLVTILWNVYPQLQWQQIHPGVWGLLANIVVLITMSLLTAPMDPDHVRDYVVE